MNQYDRSKSKIHLQQIIKVNLQKKIKALVCQVNATNNHVYSHTKQSQNPIISNLRSLLTRSVRI